MRTENEPGRTSVYHITPLPQIHNQQIEGPWTRDSPYHDFYTSFYSFPPLIWACFITINAIAITLILIPIPHIGEYPVCLVLHVYLSVLIAIVICRRRPVSRTARFLVRLGCFVLYGMASAYVSDWYLPWHGTRHRVLRQLWWYVAPGYGVYLLFAVLDKWRGWKDRRRRERGDID